MAVRYYTAVADELLPAVQGDAAGRMPACLRFVQVIGPSNPGTTVCEFEDDDASPELAGRMVTPWFASHFDECGNVTHVTVRCRERAPMAFVPDCYRQ